MQSIAIARATVQELLRRRKALIMLIALPLAFYLARRDIPSSAIVVLALGVGWAVSTLALFSTVNALQLDNRLRVAGYRTHAILTGRLVAVAIFGLVLSVAYLGLAVLDQDVTRPGGVALMMVCAVLVGAPLGMAIGLLLRSELEGAVALLIVLATQFMTNPERLFAHLLPLWSVRGVADWAIWSGDTTDLVNGLSPTVQAPSRSCSRSSPEPRPSVSGSTRHTGSYRAPHQPRRRPPPVAVVPSRRSGRRRSTGS